MDTWIVIGTVGSVIAALGTVAILIRDWWLSPPRGWQMSAEESTDGTVNLVGFRVRGAAVNYETEVHAVHVKIVKVDGLSNAQTSSDPSLLIQWEADGELHDDATVEVRWVAGTHRQPRHRGARILLATGQAQRLDRSWRTLWRHRWVNPKPQKRALPGM